jgi:hypothetical protein
MSIKTAATQHRGPYLALRAAFTEIPHNTLFSLDMKTKRRELRAF